MNLEADYQGGQEQIGLNKWISMTMEFIAEWRKTGRDEYIYKWDIEVSMDVRNIEGSIHDRAGDFGLERLESSSVWGFGRPPEIYSLCPYWSQ